MMKPETRLIAVQRIFPILLLSFSLLLKNNLQRSYNWEIRATKSRLRQSSQQIASQIVANVEMTQKLIDCATAFQIVKFISFILLDSKTSIVALKIRTNESRCARVCYLHNSKGKSFQNSVWREI